MNAMCLHRKKMLTFQLICQKDSEFEQHLLSLNL